MHLRAGLLQDRTNDALVVEDNELAYTHAGLTYSISGVSSGTVSDGSKFILTMQTPDGYPEIHARVEAIGKFAFFFRIIEGVDIVTSGSEVIPVNKNRNSANLSNVKTRFNDVTSNGDVIFSMYQVSGQLSGGVYAQPSKRILKQNTVYVFELESDANSNILSGLIEFQEVWSVYGGAV